jgi:hypothetical protein
MIDRNARDCAAILVEDFQAGRITNRTLEKRWPDTNDRGVRAIEDLIWSLYDDFKEHRIHKEDRENPELMRRIDLSTRFLRSDEAYTWPHYATVPCTRKVPRWAVMASIGLLSICNRLAERREQRYWRDMRAHGDVESWPFKQPPT